MRALLVSSLLLSGCFAAPPPAMGPQLGGCHPGSYAALSELTCRRDSDCVLCGCERLESRERLMLENPACPQPATCEERAACCQGRCVRSLGPPPL